MDDNHTRDDVLRRMLKTPPAPHKPTDKADKANSPAPDPMPTAPDALIEWGKRNIQEE